MADILKYCVEGNLNSIRSELKDFAGNLYFREKLTGNTILHIASVEGHIHIVKFILEKYPTLNDLRNDVGESALHLACERKFFKVASMLLSFHISIDVADGCGNTPLHQAASIGNVTTASYVASCKANLEAKNKEGKTALHIACELGERKVTIYLVGKGACTDALDDMNRSPLHYGCSNGYRDICNILITKHADIHIPDKEGNTPLHVACWRRKFDIAIQLLEYGASLHIANEGGNTPFDFLLDIYKRGDPTMENVGKWDKRIEDLILSQWNNKLDQDIDNRNKKINTKKDLEEVKPLENKRLFTKEYANEMESDSQPIIDENMPPHVRSPMVGKFIHNGDLDEESEVIGYDCKYRYTKPVIDIDVEDEESKSSMSSLSDPSISRCGDYGHESTVKVDKYYDPRQSIFSSMSGMTFEPSALSLIERLLKEKEDSSNNMKSDDEETISLSNNSVSDQSKFSTSSSTKNYSMMPCMRPSTASKKSIGVTPSGSVASRTFQGSFHAEEKKPVISYLNKSQSKTRRK